MNRQLQEKILRLPATQGECSCAKRNFPEIPVASDSEAMEFELGGGIFINKNVYNELFNLDHIRKFTKSLAVAMWGTATLATRSVSGKPCKNRN
nr:BEN domain-containing protein 5-like [Parasteatoda tepidariorum]